MILLTREFSMKEQPGRFFPGQHNTVIRIKNYRKDLLTQNQYSVSSESVRKKPFKPLKSFKAFKALVLCAPLAQLNAKPI